MGQTRIKHAINRDHANFLMERFGNVEPNVLALLKSTTAIYSISEEDLYFKWESWSFKMGNDPELNYANVTLFKQDIQNQLEYSNQVRNKATPASTRKLPGKADFDDLYQIQHHEKR